MPAKKFKTMKKRRTKYNKMRKSKKSGGGVFDRYESVSNIGRDSGSYAKPNNNVKKLVKKYNEFGLNKKSTGNYDRLNSKRKRISRRK